MASFRYRTKEQLIADTPSRHARTPLSSAILPSSPPPQLVVDDTDEKSCGLRRRDGISWYEERVLRRTMCEFTVKVMDALHMLVVPKVVAQV